MQGFILEVSISPSGDELDSDHLTGDTAIGLVDWDDFELDGGSVDINGTIYEYTAVDDETGTMTLASGLVEDLEAGTQVYLDPPVNEKWAMVEVQENEDVLLALVPQQLWDRISDGVRDPEEQEPVVVVQQEGDWIISNVVGEEPVLDGTFLDPETVPTNAAVDTALTDLRTEVDTNTGQLTNILGDETQAGRLQNVEETATQARNLANTADGRVSMSDYQPAPEDVQYYATDKDGNLILDGDGNPVLLDRNEGSIWFVRTRARVNLCANPSFETNTTSWSTSLLTMTREASSVAPAGGYVLRLNNNTTAGNHVLTYDGGAPEGIPAVAEAAYTFSIFAELVTGSGAGVFAQLEFFDNTGASLGVFNGDAVQLVASDWASVGASIRPNVTAVAPVGTASVVGRVINPTASDAWRVDAALFEMSNILGRYFDGSLYDSRWGDDGKATAHASQSYMRGGKVTEIWELDDGAWVEKVFMGDTLVDLNASQITVGYMDGERIQDRSVPIDKLSASPVTASEALTAGQLVNIYSTSTGSFRARKASAAAGYRAAGFVLENAASGAIAYVYSFGYNPFLSGLKPGAVFLGNSGAVSMTPPAAASGTIVQQVGTAVGPSVLNFTPGPSIKIV